MWQGPAYRPRQGIRNAQPESGWQAVRRRLAFSTGRSNAGLGFGLPIGVVLVQARVQPSGQSAERAQRTDHQTRSTSSYVQIRSLTPGLPTAAW